MKIHKTRDQPKYTKSQICINLSYLFHFKLIYKRKINNFTKSKVDLNYFLYMMRIKF